MCLDLYFGAYFGSYLHLILHVEYTDKVNLQRIWLSKISLKGHPWVLSKLLTLGSRNEKDKIVAGQENLHELTKIIHGMTKLQRVHINGCRRCTFVSSRFGYNLLENFFFGLSWCQFYACVS